MASQQKSQKYQWNVNFLGGVINHDISTTLNGHTRKSLPPVVTGAGSREKPAPREEPVPWPSPGQALAKAGTGAGDTKKSQILPKFSCISCVSWFKKEKFIIFVVKRSTMKGIVTAKIPTKCYYSDT